MKLIPLTQGQFAQVDDHNYEWLNKYKWYAIKFKYSYYAVRGEYDKVAYEKNGISTNKRIWMHRVILKITDPTLYGDHINHNGLDNQEVNLRTVTRSQNMTNKIGTGKSKYVGVNLNIDKRQNSSKLWISRITINGKRIHIGRYHTEKEAAIAYNEYAIKHNIEFANLNII